jgi:hypothetical protein
LIDGIGSLPYCKRLEAFQIATLAERHVRGDLIEVFKVVNAFGVWTEYISIKQIRRYIFLRTRRNSENIYLIILMLQNCFVHL